MGSSPARMAPAVPLEVAGIAYAPGAIVSRALVSGPSGSVTLFAFDAGQELSEHTAPFDALVHVLEGEAVLVIGGKEVRAPEGSLVLMPGGVPHAVRSPGRFRMLLTMIRQAPGA